MERTQKEREYISNRFNIPIEDAVWYHSGICFSRACVLSKESALKIKEQVKDRCVNGGAYDGVSLGRCHEYELDGIRYYEVTC